MSDEAVPFGSERVNLVAREKMARAIIAYWQDFSARVPRLSPTENEWLKTEIGKTGERVNLAINSKEYALWRLDLHIGDCIGLAEGILEVQSDSKTKEIEMLYWAQMINCYDNTNYVQIYLQQAGLSDGRADGPFRTDLNGLIHTNIVNIVIPSAMADTMGWTLGK